MKPISNLALTMTVAISTMGMAFAAGESTKLTMACEEALALSALPARLRDGASVYTLTGSEFELTRKGKGEFTCLVARNHATAIIPQCADAEGADTVIPGIIKRTEWTLAGVDAKEQESRFERLASEGVFRAPERSGINYMMSNFNFIWNAQQEETMHVGPHVMYYAPNVSNEQIGGSMQEAMGSNRGTPVIIEEGIHGYITSFVEHPASSADVLAACKGQVKFPDADSPASGS